MLDPALEAGGFDAVLMLGVASRARTIRVERRAVNRASVLFPDAAAQHPSQVAMRRGAPYQVTRAALTPALVALRRRELVVALSQDAGRYLCNAAYWRALARPAPALFVHVPKSPRAAQPVAHRTRRRLGWRDQLVAGLADVALGLLRQARAYPRRR